MNPTKFSIAALVAASALAGCASAPPITEEQKSENCQVEALMVGVGQNALNAGMDEDDFNERVEAIEKYEKLDANDRKLAVAALRRGYNSIEGADVGIMAQKAYDDCMVK